MLKDKTFIVFALSSFFFCLLMSFLFQPISWQVQGDSTAYIELARQFLNISTDPVDLSGRQPLYSLIIAPFIYFFNEEDFLYPLMYLQFLMVFVSSLLVYQTFNKLHFYRYLALISASLYLLSLSTLFYAFNILSETLSLLIFVLIAYVLIINSYKNDLFLWVVIGLLNGLMVLARFNTIGLPIVAILCLLLIHYRNYGFTKIIKLSKSLLCYSLGVFVILNSWSLYNYYTNGFYGVIPSQHKGQRWAVPATITKKNTVSAENQHLLNIYIKARETYLMNQPSEKIKKGSLLEYKFIRRIVDVMEPAVNGYRIYKLAEPELLKYYHLDYTSQNVATVGKKLIPFYDEIARQNKKELFRLRIYSLFQTFRASGNTLPLKEKINLNILPGFIFKIFKVLMFIIIFLTYITAFFHFILKIYKIKNYDYWRLFILILLIGYFPIVHFYANVLGDANRFKFPAEPLITGLMLFYLLKTLNWLRIKKNNILKSTPTY
jgi:hypothetical protein